MPLVNSGEESGVGRWFTLQISTLSFYEYLQIKKVSLPTVPKISQITDLFKTSNSDYLKQIISCR